MEIVTSCYLCCLICWLCCFFVIRVVLLLIVMFYVLFMRKYLLPPGVNPIAVDKYINILLVTYIDSNTFKLCPIKRQWSECIETTNSDLTSLTTFMHRHAAEQVARDSDLTTSCISDKSWFNSQKDQEIYLFPKASKPALKPTRPPVQTISKTYYLGVIRSKCGFGCSIHIFPRLK
jgi:hypothetical protein